MLAAPAVADAASVAYIENGEVWVVLAGRRARRCASPRRWSTATARPRSGSRSRPSDGGRIVAARNKPGRIVAASRGSRSGSRTARSTVEGPLNCPGGLVDATSYPLGFDVTADGAHMVYGYSNTSGCCPYTFGRGTYVRPVTNSSLEPIAISGYEDPTLFGSRVIAHVRLDDRTSRPRDDLRDRLRALAGRVAGTGLDCAARDVAANGQLVALRARAVEHADQTIGKIGVLSIAGVDRRHLQPARGRLLPARRPASRRTSRSPRTARFDRVDRRPGPQGRRRRRLDADESARSRRRRS